MAQNGGPNVLWRMFEDPETAEGMINEGDRLAQSGVDFVVVALEVDGVVVVDAAGIHRGDGASEPAAPDHSAVALSLNGLNTFRPGRRKS